MCRRPQQGEAAAVASENGSCAGPTAADQAFKEMVKLDERRKGFMTMGDTLRWRIFFQLTHTILPSLSTNALFNGCIALFLAVRTLVTLEYLNTDEESRFQGVTLLGGGVTFFLIFYASQTYERFAALYTHAMDAGSELQQITILARASLPPLHAMRVIRQINAAHVLAHTAIEDHCTAQVLEGFNNAYSFLTEEEMKVVATMDLHSAGPMSALISWIVMDMANTTAPDTVDVAGATETGRLHLIRGEQISCKAVAVKSHLMRLFHYREQPLPFLYVHLATLLVYVYMPLLTLVLAIGPTEHSQPELWEVQNALAFIFSALFFVGLRETARLMSDPFGNDDFDFPMIGYSIDTIERCRALMAVPDAEAIQVREEENVMDEAKEE